MIIDLSGNVSRTAYYSTLELVTPVVLKWLVNLTLNSKARDFCVIFVPEMWVSFYICLISKVDQYKVINLLWSFKNIVFLYASRGHHQHNLLLDYGHCYYKAAKRVDNYVLHDIIVK